MTQPVTTLVVSVLAVWRITHLFWGEDGPGGIVVRLRRLAGDGFVGRLLDCFYCLSIWVAAPVAWVVADPWLDRVLLWFGLSGGAILLERIAARTMPAPPAHWQERSLPGNKQEEELENAVLQ